jgi:hypothetical protein
MMTASDLKRAFCAFGPLNLHTHNTHTTQDALHTAASTETGLATIVTPLCLWLGSHI